MKEIFTSQDLVHSIARHMNMQQLSALPGVCRQWNDFLSLENANLHNVIGDFRDQDMTRAYTHALTCKDLTQYTDDMRDYTRKNIHHEFKNFIEWRYNHQDRRTGLLNPPIYATVPCDMQPLHMALQMRKSTKVLMNLIRSNTEALKMRDIYGNNALHLAVIHNAENVVIMTILNRYAEATQHANADLHFPLHLFLKHRHSPPGTTPSDPEIVQCMVDSYGKIKHDATVYAKWALRSAMDKQKAWAVRILIDAYPALVLSSQVCLLRMSLANKYSPEIIYMLLDANPAAARVCLHGMYPIHVAIKYDTPAEVIQYMIEQEPESIKWVYKSSNSYASKFGHLKRTYIPIQLAAECGRKDVLQVLCAADPESVSVFIDESRWSALHFAVYGIENATLSDPEKHKVYHARRRDAIMFLIEVCESASTRADMIGCFPVSAVIKLARKNPMYIDVAVRLIRAHVNTSSNPSSELCMELASCEQLMLEKTLTLRDISSLVNSFAGILSLQN